MRRILAPLLFVAAVPAATLAQSSAPGPALPAAQKTFPANAMGRVGEALLDAVNGGDSAAMSRFVAERLGADVRGRSPATLTRMLVKLHRQSDGLVLERVRPVGTALRVMAQAKNGRRWLGIEIEPTTADSTRASIMFYPTDNPGMTGPPQPWATEALTDAQLATLIREKVRAAADSDRFSGVVLVAHGDEVLVHETVGFADRAGGRAITPDTRYPTFSLGKMFTGVAIAQLVAEGKLRWEDTVARVLPSYPNREAAESITIAEVLTHTAGVPDPFMSARYKRDSVYASHSDMLATFADAPLRASRGSFDYSNGGYVTLAAVVEQLSGLSYEEYLRRHVFGPAGMTLPKSELAIGYAQFSHLDPLGIEQRTPSTSGPRREPRPRGFGDGAYTAEDLYRFARALRTGKLLPPAVADSAVAPRARMGTRMRYGYGFYSMEMHGVRVLGHSGSNPSTGYDADLQMVWEGDWTVVVLSNYDAPAGREMEMPILDLLARQVALRR